jgi:hypothetical protein
MGVLKLLQMLSPAWASRLMNVGVITASVWRFLVGTLTGVFVLVLAERQRDELRALALRMQKVLPKTTVSPPDGSPPGPVPSRAHQAAVRVVGPVFGVLILGIIQTLVMFDGTLSSWWTKIAIGMRLFVFCLMQRVFEASSLKPRRETYVSRSQTSSPAM